MKKIFLILFLGFQLVTPMAGAGEDEERMWLYFYGHPESVDIRACMPPGVKAVKEYFFSDNTSLFWLAYPEAYVALQESHCYQHVKIVMNYYVTDILRAHGAYREAEIMDEILFQRALRSLQKAFGKIEKL